MCLQTSDLGQLTAAITMLDLKCSVLAARTFVLPLVRFWR
jgi:hypothetical protein